MAAVRRLVAQLAVALARDLARVRHQTAGDESFADTLSHVSCCVQLAARRDPTFSTLQVGRIRDDYERHQMRHREKMFCHFMLGD